MGKFKVNPIASVVAEKGSTFIEVDPDFRNGLKGIKGLAISIFYFGLIKMIMRRQGDLLKDHSLIRRPLMCSGCLCNKEGGP